MKLQVFKSCLLALSLTSLSDAWVLSERSATPTSSSSTSSSTSSTPTLLPAVHWNFPVNDIRNLAPSNATELYYSSNGISDPSVQHLFASLNTTLQNDVVVLDHSVYVSNTSCTNGGITVTFNSSTAFNYAASTWSSVPQFVLVTYTAGCGTSATQRSFWLVEGITLQNSTLSIVAQVLDEIAIENILSGVSLIWGTYFPPWLNGSSWNSTSGTGTGSNSTGNSGNSTGPGSGSSCGPAPSSTVDGLPAANCGDPNFDSDIDAEIGYFDLTSGDYSSVVEDFAPGVDFSGDDLEDDDPENDDDDDDGSSSKRSLIMRKRALRLRQRKLKQKRSVWDWVKQSAQTVANAAVSVANTGVQLAQQAVQAIPTIADEIAQGTEVNPTIGGNANIFLTPDDSATSPWGPAASIYSHSSSGSTTDTDVELFCVDCGVTGQVALAGQASFSITGLQGLEVNVNANLQAGVNLGIAASVTYSNTMDKPLINAPIPDLGVSVKGVFSAGAFVTVDAVASLEIDAQGQALVGALVSLPNFQATLDLVGSGSGVSGYTPTLSPNLKAAGSVSATANLSLPIAFNIGLEIPPINFKKTAALIEEPSITGTVTAAGSVGGAGPASSTCNNGYSYYVNVNNDVYVDFFGSYTTNLNHYSDSPPLLQGCSGTSSSKRNLLDVESYLHRRNKQSANTATSASSSSSSPSSSSSSSSSNNNNNNSTTIASGNEPTFTSNPSDSVDQTNDPVDSDSSNPDNTEYQDDSSDAQTQSSDAATENGFAYNEIVEQHGSFKVVPDQDGNLYAASTQGNPDVTLFAVLDNTAAMDDAFRPIHYYPDEMSTYNASRVRLSNETMIPKTADFAGFRSLDYDNNSATPNILFAVSTEGVPYNTVICNFANGADSKLFLVNGAAGLNTLQTNNDVKYTVTGAPVSKCEPVALVFGPPSTS